jgi:putative oxidoreductase
MLAAFYLGHLPRGGWPIQNNGELALVYSVIFLFLAGNGGGMWSLDKGR